MLEFIKIINSDYAGVLSLLSSLIMVVVTIIYVGHTKRQANYAKESAELVAKQMKIDKQPCIVPYVTDSCGSAWDTTDYSPACNAFTYSPNEKSVMIVSLLSSCTSPPSTLSSMRSPCWLTHRRRPRPISCLLRMSESLCFFSVQI